MLLFLAASRVGRKSWAPSAGCYHRKAGVGMTGKVFLEGSTHIYAHIVIINKSTLEHTHPTHAHTHTHGATDIHTDPDLQVYHNPTTICSYSHSQRHMFAQV